MKNDNLIAIGLLGALAAAAYFFRGGDSGGFSGGGGAGGEAGYTGLENLLPAAKNEPLKITGYATPSQYVVTQGKITTVVKKTGSHLETFQITGDTNKAAKITVGTPAEQIEQFSTGSKLIKVGGKIFKVM